MFISDYVDFLNYQSINLLGMKKINTKAVY